MRSLSLLMFFPLALLPGFAFPEQATWEEELARLRDAVAIRHVALNRFSVPLQARVRAELPSRLDETYVEPSSPQRGWGLLPQLVKQEQTANSGLRETIYTLAWIDEQLIASDGRLETLDQRLAADGSVGSIVDEFRSLSAEALNLQAHVNYHQQWQSSIRRFPGYFQKRKALLPAAEALAAAQEADHDAVREQQLRDQLLSELVTFRPAAALTVERDRDGWHLPVDICTDIKDKDFLAETGRVIEKIFRLPATDSEAAFQVHLNWQNIDLRTHYPDKRLPKHGEAIDLDDHLSRILTCPRVLTTGAASTFASTGAYIVLGNARMHPRVLAHEFGHLLGFEDAYLRAFRGDLGQREGLTIIEWWGISNDIMGDSKNGRVSRAMVEQLINAYPPSPDLRKKQRTVRE